MKLDIIGYWGGFPAHGGATTGYMITTDQGHFLIDCGSGVVSRYLELVDINQLQGVILTHLHHDHRGDIEALQQALKVSKTLEKIDHRITIYHPATPKKAADFIQTKHADFQVYDHHSSISLAGADLTFMKTDHGIECYAVRVESNNKVIAFSADSAYLDEFIPFVNQADIFLCETTNVQGSRHSKGDGHMNGKEAGKIANLAKVKHLILTHFPSDGDLERIRQDALSTYSGKITLVKEHPSYSI